MPSAVSAPALLFVFKLGLGLHVFRLGPSFGLSVPRGLGPSLVQSDFASARPTVSDD